MSRHWVVLVQSKSHLYSATTGAQTRKHPSWFGCVRRKRIRGGRREERGWRESMDAGAVVSLVIKKLTDMLIQESIIFKEVIDEVELVRVSLRRTQNFLIDAEDRKERNYKVKKWLEEFLDLVYNAEDAIETFVLYRMYIRNMGFSRRLTFIRKKLRHGADLRSEVEKIKNKIKDIKNKIEEIKEPKHTSYSVNKESDPIGFKEDKKRLLTRLTDTFLPRLHIISIVGQVGSGKTTLATALYDSSKINRHFDCRMWVSASENLRDSLLSILRQTDNSMVGEKTAITELEAKIEERLRNKRYLVVLDDVRSRNALEALRALPKQTNGSRVLLTTNNEDVARFADPSRLPYHLNPLKDDDAWNLFLKMIRLPKNVQFSELEISELKTRIIRRCKGLPLAIVELGDFLSPRAASYGEWLKVLDHPVWQLGRNEDLHNEVEDIKNKINEIKEEEEHGEPLRIQEYLNVRKSSNQDEGLRQNQQNNSSYSMDEERSDVIGFQKHKRRLVTRLTDTYLRRLHVISILGPVGSGKTTLAMEIYGSNEIRYHFDFRAWVSASENLRDVCLMLLEQAENSMDYEEAATEELVEKLREKLHNKRYLVVLDDVCSRDVLNNLRNALPNETNGSRVLLTTSNEGVARSADPSRMPYHLQPLEDDDAWNLFLKKVRLSEKNIQFSAFEISELKRRIRRRCKGLPLAIVVLGGFLSTKGMSYEEWSQVLDHQSLQLDINGVEFSKILALSYNDLPFHLRPCLFYFGLFPKGYEIPVRRLLLLWLAEGFAKPSLEKTPEDVVEGYLDELIKRQMIQIKKWRKDGSPKRCLMRGELREIISSKAEDIGFLHIQGIMSGPEANESPKRSVRRVAGHGDIKEYPRKELYIQHLRSYLSFNTQNKDMPAKEIRNFLNKVVGYRGFGLLRVLDLERVYKPSLSENLEKLFHLRYLGLRWTFLDTLPDSASELPYLETLDVKHTYISSLPISIWKMKHIRHLCLNEICFDMSVQKHNSSFTQLQTFWGLLVDKKSPVKNGLNKLVNLRKLGLTNHLDSVQELNEWIARLASLQSLRLRSKDENGRPSKLGLNSLSSLENLTHLYLLGNLPELQDGFEFPPRLRVLTFLVLKLEKDPCQS